MDPDRRSVFYDVKRRLRKGKSEDLFVQFTRLAGYNGVAAALLFSLHVIMARLLGPAQYADYGVVIALLLTFLVSATSIQLIITRFISYHHSRYQPEQITYLVRKSLKWSFAAGLALFLLTLLLAQPISEFLQLNNFIAVVLLGFVLWFTVMQPVFEGAFRGYEQFGELGRMRLIEAFLRLVFVTSFVLAGFAISGAVFGLGLGTFVALAFSYKHLYRLQKRKAAVPNLARIRRYAVPVILSMVSFSLLLNLDLILVRHYFSAAEAGVFAAASFLAKAPVFVSLVFVGVLFPRVTRMHAQGKNSVSTLRSALVVITSVMFVTTLLSFFFADWLLLLIFGSGYSLGPVLGFYVFGMSALAIGMVLVVYLLALQKDRVAFALPLFVFALVGLLSWFHASLTQVILVVLFVLVSFAAYVVYCARDFLEFDYFL